jgi:hypothetical protein
MADVDPIFGAETLSRSSRFSSPKDGAKRIMDAPVSSEFKALRFRNGEKGDGMRRLVALMFAILCGAAIAAAQQKPQHADKWEIFGGYSFARTYGMPNISGGGKESSDEYAAYNMNGGEAAVTYYPIRHFGITAEFTALTNNQTLTDKVAVGSGIVPEGPGNLSLTQVEHMQSYLFGPTVRFGLKHEPRISFFAHQLYGVSHTYGNVTSSEGDTGCVFDDEDSMSGCTANSFTLASGGGFDVKVSHHVSIRPVQLDYWSLQPSAKAFDEGDSEEEGSAKYGVDGFRYTAGASYSF